MSTNYDISLLFARSGCRVVFVEDTQTALALAEAVTQYDMDYHDRINDVLASRIGLFKRKNKQSIWNILKKTQTVREEGLAFLQQQTERMEIKYYENRYPMALSRLQKERVSVLYDTLSGRKKFLLSDCSRDPNGDGYIFIRLTDHYFTIATYLNSYHGAGSFDLIWITGMPKTDVLDYITEEEFFSSAFYFYCIDGQSVREQDKQVLISQMLPTTPEIEQFCQRSEVAQLTREEQFAKGYKCDPLSGAATDRGPKDAKLAFLWYAAAALGGYLPAQNKLGLFYEFGNDVCEIDMDKALFWYLKAAFHKKYYEALADEETKFYYEGAKRNLERLVTKMPGAEEQILRYGGKEGEEIVQIAKIEQELKGKRLFDPEYMRKVMNEIRREWIV